MGANKIATCHIQIRGEGNSRSEEIDLFPFVIGRGEDADIKILASGISRSHISVSIKEGSLWIEDLGSANGTFLNDKRLNPKMPVPYNKGDAIRLGLNNDILTFSLVEEKSSEPHEVILPPLPNHIPTQKPAPVDISASEPDHLEEAKAAALRIKITAETEAAKILQVARDLGHDELSKARVEAAAIVGKANDQAFRLQREGEVEAKKIRQAMQDALSKGLAESEEKVEVILKEARLSATTIKATAQTEADGIISKAYEKVLEIKEKGDEDVKTRQKVEKKKGSEIIERAQREADKILEEAHSASIKIRENIDKEIEAIKARVEKEARQNTDDLVRSAAAEAEKIKKDAVKAAQKMSDEVLRSERATHLNTFEKESRNLAETLLVAQTSLKNLEEEKGHLHDHIDEYKKKEENLVKDFEEKKGKLTKEYDELKTKSLKGNMDSMANLTQELVEFKAKLTKEKEDYQIQIENEKNKMTTLVLEEERTVREKAKAEFYLQREKLEADFSKSRILEISKALETYIIPRIKEGLNGEEIPNSLNNFSSDLRDIVKKVINGDYSEMVADTVMDTSLKHKSSSWRAKILLFATLGGGTAVLAFMAYTSLQDPTSVLRRPAQAATLSTTTEYKGSYTDNVLYTKDYVTLKLNPKNYDAWKTEVNNFLTNNLGLEKSKVEKFMTLEFQLVNQLAALRSEIRAENKRDSIQKMATLEKLSTDQFIDDLGSQENYNTFRDFEKNYLERNRAPANQN